MRHAQQGAILVLVLVVLALLGLLGAAVSRQASQRALAAAEYRARVLARLTPAAANPDGAGGTDTISHATIGDGANDAPLP